MRGEAWRHSFQPRVITDSDIALFFSLGALLRWTQASFQILAAIVSRQLLISYDGIESGSGWPLQLLEARNDQEPRWVAQTFCFASTSLFEPSTLTKIFRHCSLALN